MSTGKKFTLQNMESYFRNYIPCQQHPQYPVSNFCVEPTCSKILCPECVEIHSKNHEAHQVQSIHSAISRCSKKLKNVIDILQNQKSTSAIGKMSSPEEYTEQSTHTQSHSYQQQTSNPANSVISGVRKLRKQIIQEVNFYFDEYQKRIKKQIRNKWAKHQEYANASNKLNTAVQQLQLLHNNLFLTSHTLQASKKVNQLDFKALVQHFRTQLDSAKAKLNMNVNITIDEGMRSQFKKTLANLIEVGSSKEAVHEQFDKPVKGGREAKGGNVVEYDPKDRKTDKQGSMPQIKEKALYPVSSHPYEENRMLEITMANWFLNNPFLHFFQTSNQKLHYLSIEELDSQECSWKVINLNIQFDIPTFHKSIALRNGLIFLVGGSWGEKKLSKIYQYESGSDKLLEVSNMSIPRSSHALAAINDRIYIVGGFTTGGVTTNKCELFQATTYRNMRIADCQYASSNSSLTAVNNRYLLKVGGLLEDETNCHFIERYDCQSNTWELIDPIIQMVQGDFSLLSTSASIQINDNQIFIFGGYNEEAGNEVSNSSFVLGWNKSEYQITHINEKPLPIAEGFWNSMPVVYNRRIYCLQNVADSNSNNCLENRRNVLVFNGRIWKHVQI